MSTNEILGQLRPLIQEGRADCLALTYAQLEEEYQGRGHRVDWAEIWKRSFILACTQEQMEVAKWLYGRYVEAPLGFRLGLRPTFHYCHALLARSKGTSSARRQALLAWLDNCKTVTATGIASEM